MTLAVVWYVRLHDGLSATSYKGCSVGQNLRCYRFTYDIILILKHSIDELITITAAENDVN